MSNPDISRLLLDYIVTARGICHENALILALIRLKMDYNEFDPAWSLQKWNTELNDNIDHINVKLNTLNYKIVKISHGMGKNAVTARNRQKFGLLEPKNMATDENNNSNQYENNEDDEDINNNIDNNNNNNNNNSRSTTPNDGRAGIILPESNKFYVYVNMEPTDETKLATRFQEKEIAFVKWSIEQFVEHAMTIEPIQNNDIESNIIYKEINTLLNSLSHPIKDIANANIEDIQEDFKNRGGIKWKQFISFTARSTNLLRYEALGAAEIENLLLQLQQRQKSGMDLYFDRAFDYMGQHPVLTGLGIFFGIYASAGIYRSVSIKMNGGKAASQFLKGGFDPKMNMKEALQILNLKENNLTKKKLKEVHRKIMLANHPDKGGSPYVATKINEAKDFLEKKGVVRK